jgi:3-oxoacyl-[acyl-carrier protein] reductase
MDQSLAGKIALVTGSGRGIGQAIAIAYAARGAQVVCSARSQNEIDDTAAQIKTAGGQAIALAADVGNQEQVETLFSAAIAHFGGLDILVANAGVHLERKSVAQSDPQRWWQTLETNLFGAYLCCRAALPHLKARGGGKIITIGSGMGHKGLANNTAYCCSKAALSMLTRTLAQEVQKDQISVNELIPGPVQTELAGHSEQRQDSVFSIDGEWIKEPEDVVPLAVFLATQPPIGPTAQSFSLMRRDN